jgi:hypothetical protein
MLGIAWGEQSVNPAHQRRNASVASAAGFPAAVADPEPIAADAPVPDPAAWAQSQGIVNQPMRHVSFTQGPDACPATRPRLDGMPGASHRFTPRRRNL